jgi:hypothetical protein
MHEVERSLPATMWQAFDIHACAWMPPSHGGVGHHHASVLPISLYIWSLRLRLLSEVFTVAKKHATPGQPPVQPNHGSHDLNFLQ